MIRITDVVKSYGPNRILAGASLTAHPGELTALIGPSGGGKSTLLRCINGLETFDSGSIDVFGFHLEGTGTQPQPAAVLRDVRRKVGMVFQQFHLFPHLTALANVMSGPLQVCRATRASAEITARKLLSRVGLADKADVRPSKLSGGQQQRVAIARALAVDPAAVLFDEPTSALDPEMVEEVLSVMRSLAHDGLTMLVVTHDMDIARQAHRVHHLVGGIVAATGTPAELHTLFHAPQDRTP